MNRILQAGCGVRVMYNCTDDLKLTICYFISLLACMLHVLKTYRIQIINYEFQSHLHFVCFVSCFKMRHNYFADVSSIVYTCHFASVSRLFRKWTRDHRASERNRMLQSKFCALIETSNDRKFSRSKHISYIDL